jgi:pyroglutamyl-peptidase
MLFRVRACEHMIPRRALVEFSVEEINSAFVQYGNARRVLVTAFGRFEEGPNCSATLLDALAEDRAALEESWGGPVSFALFDVDSVAIREALAAALAASRPTHVLLMGQAAGRGALSLERRAFNERRLRVPDAAGRIGDLGPVAPAGPAALEATWPDLAGVAAAIEAEGAPAAVSDDAGRHLCNQTLYLALQAAEKAQPRFVATFLHLPLLPEQVAAGIPAADRQGAACPSLALDDMARAVHAVLRHTRRAAA